MFIVAFPAGPPAATKLLLRQREMLQDHDAPIQVITIAWRMLFHEKAGSVDKTLKLYEGYFHDPLSDVGKELVLADIRGWIDAHIPT